MNVGYVDSSVILRVLLRENLNPIATGQFDRLYTSEITQLECKRVLDRVRIQERIPDEELASRYLELKDRLSSVHTIKISSALLKRAGETFPVVVRTLDSIHLASFILIQSQISDGNWTFLTHDHQLKTAVQSLGFVAVG